MKTWIHLMCFGIFLFWASPISSAMSGGAYTIYADSFSFIDTATTSGDTFAITGTGGEFAMASTSGDTFVLRSGFQAAERGVLSFLLSSGALSIGPLSVNAVSPAGVTLTVSTDSETGYTMAITENGDLRFGSDSINDVSDGSVTAGFEEYGIRTSGDDGLLGTDTAISGNLTVASASGRVINRQTVVTFSASMGSNTPPGTYSHIVTFTITVNP